MSYFGPTGCCGLDEYYGLNTNVDVADIPRELFLYSLDENRGMDPTWSTVRVSTQIVLTAVQPQSTGNHRARYHYGADKKLVALVKKHKLGTIVSSPLKLNPNSGNKIKCYLWAVSVSGLKAYLQGPWKKKNPEEYKDLDEQLQGRTARRGLAPMYW